MKNNSVKEYPPCPRLIKQSRLDTLWVAVPVCFCLSFIRNVGFIFAIILLTIWIMVLITETQNDWKTLCDTGMTNLEVDQRYLLKYGFIQEKIGSPVRKATDEELMAWMKHEIDPFAFRYDSPFHPIDEKHGIYDEKVGIWLTKEERRERENFNKAALDERAAAWTDFYRMYNKLEVEYGNDFWYIYQYLKQSEEAKKRYVRIMENMPEGIEKEAMLYATLSKIRDNENPNPKDIPEARYKEIKEKCLKLLEIKKKGDLPTQELTWKYPEF